MRHVERLLVCLVLTPSLVTQRGEAPPASSAHRDLLEEGARELLQHRSIHSVSLGLFYRGEGVSVHLGELDPERDNVPTDDTIYSVASVTKTLTGYLAARAVLDGKLELDDDVREYLSGSYPNLVHADEPIRIHHLLTHQSQLPAELVGLDGFLEAGDLQGALDFAAGYTKEDFFEDLRSMRLVTTPGSGYLYSSNGTNLLAYTLEEVYDKPYASLLEELIFDPAGMADSALELRDDQRDRLAHGYDGEGRRTPAQPRFLVGADGYLKSTTRDLIEYMRFQLDDENRAAQESRRRINARGAPMGYFWQIEGPSPVPHVKHAGTAIGTTTWTILCPEDDLGLTLIISSRFPGSTEVLYDSAMELVQALRSK